MSDVKMCDNCGDIFSVNSQGWDSYTKNRMQLTPGNSHPVQVGTVVLHICEKCNIGQAGNLKPRIAIESGDDK